MSFVKYNTDDVTVAVETVVAPLWSGGISALTASNFFTSSVQENSVSGLSYLNVYNLDTATSGSAVQFSLAYANASGSGSSTFNALIPQFSSTRDIYGQFRNIIYGDENTAFTFGGSSYVSGDFFVINVARARYKEGLQPGTLRLVLQNASGSLTLTDDSLNNTTSNFIGTNQYYNIVSGSGGTSYNGTTVQTPSGSYGIFFPALATLIINARALTLPAVSGGLAVSIDQTPSTGYSASYSTNNKTFFNLMKTGGNFTLNSYESVSSRFFFTRVKNADFNYTTNPSIIDNNGNVLFTTLVNNPQTFPTMAGLYNEQGELLAVAKLSKPLAKDFTSELLLRIKLSF